MIRLSSVQARFLVPGGSHGQAAWGLRLLAFLGASLLIVLGLGGVAVRAGHTTDAAERPSTSSVHIYDSSVHPYDQQPAWSVSLRERRGGTTGPWTGLDGQREVVTRALDGSGVAAETDTAAASIIARLDPGALPASEASALDKTVGYIDSGTTPSGALAKNWGASFKNWGKDLPGGVGEDSPYLEYRVAPPAGTSGAGPMRVVLNQNTGDMYYTWTHYGDSGPPAFVQIR